MKNESIIYDEAEIKVKKVDNQIVFTVENFITEAASRNIPRYARIASKPS